MKFQELIDKHPVDIIIDFSSNSGIYTYGEVAALRKVKMFYCLPSSFNSLILFFSNASFLAAATFAFFSK